MLACKSLKTFDQSNGVQSNLIRLTFVWEFEMATLKFKSNPLLETSSVLLEVSEYGVFWMSFQMHFFEGEIRTCAPQVVYDYAVKSFETFFRFFSTTRHLKYNGKYYLIKKIKMYFRQFLFFFSFKHTRGLFAKWR